MCVWKDRGEGFDHLCGASLSLHKEAKIGRDAFWNGATYLPTAETHWRILDQESQTVPSRSALPLLGPRDNLSSRYWVRFPFILFGGVFRKRGSVASLGNSPWVLISLVQKEDFRECASLKSEISECSATFKFKCFADLQVHRWKSESVQKKLYSLLTG